MSRPVLTTATSSFVGQGQTRRLPARIGENRTVRCVGLAAESLICDRDCPVVKSRSTSKNSLVVVVRQNTLSPTIHGGPRDRIIASDSSSLSAPNARHLIRPSSCGSKANIVPDSESTHARKSSSSLVANDVVRFPQRRGG